MPNGFTVVRSPVPVGAPASRGRNLAWSRPTGLSPARFDGDGLIQRKAREPGGP